MQNIYSWGRLSKDIHNIINLHFESEVRKNVACTQLPAISYGAGRSYGDVCLNPQGSLWRLSGLNRFISFDSETGILKCQAGMLLKDINQLLVPRGWILPVMPGTQYVTVGGAIANDVHGKNHHQKGSFGHHIKSIQLFRTTGEMQMLTTKDKLFAATIGGLGLTGIIISAELQLAPLRSQWLKVEVIPFCTVDAFVELSFQSLQWEFSVAWFDCLSPNGKGLFMRANFLDDERPVAPKKRVWSIPFSPPISCVNRYSLKAFNYIYYSFNKNKKEQISHYEKFFFPLDNILDWNKLYGSQGFYQYQCLIPKNQAIEGIRKILNEIKKDQMGSFLSVLKVFGDRDSLGMLSFPQAGITFALDFPNLGEKTLNLLSRLDKIVLESGGRIYPAKDACMSKILFEAGYPRLNEFLSYRDSGISSAFSRRLMGY